MEVVWACWIPRWMEVGVVYGIGPTVSGQRALRRYCECSALGPNMIMRSVVKKAICFF